MASTGILRIMALIGCIGFMMNVLDAGPRQILVDTDLDIDDIFALLYLLKQNRSEFDLQAITINANGWSDAGHAINHLYDILFMMNRDDIPVGVGGEGGISPNGIIMPEVGGYLPIIDQGMSTEGGCRYRQAIPLGLRGRLDINTNYGLRKGFLPKGRRKYIPLKQASAQQVMKDAISSGPITVFLMGTHTNFALFLMTNPHLKRNVEHIYAMGGAIRSTCSNVSDHSQPAASANIGNLFPQDSNPYAEFNIFGDPFAAYEVLHSGIPVTLVPLDATRTIPIDKNFFQAFERRQDTYEAQYCFQSLKMVRDTWFSDDFHENYCMWDSFMVGVAISKMRNQQNLEVENAFAEMEYMNITVVTSNKPYGVSDGSNPFFDGLPVPKFRLRDNGVHSGHVQMGMRDPFCEAESKGTCQDGYTEEVTGPEAVRVLVATKAKPSQDAKSSLNKEFYESFLNVLNNPEQSGRFNITTQFPHYEEIVLKPDSDMRSTGKPVVFDMDMSAGDFLSLLYLLKVPREIIDLKGIIGSSTGWATAATVDIVYDVLHMMGRDDIPVGLGDAFAYEQTDPTFPAIGDCKYRKAIPQGSGGFLDADTLYGLSRDLPSSPRRYTAENSMRFGAPRNTDHPEFRQPLAVDVWKSVVKSLEPAAKITILSNGPLTNLASIIHLKNSSSVIQDIHVVGGHVGDGNERGNLFTVPSNKFAEFNMFLDPLAAKAVFTSGLNITLIPLSMQRRVSSFPIILNKLQFANRTPEASMAHHLLTTLWNLRQKHNRYHHMDLFLGEILGAVILASNISHLNRTFEFKPLKILADGDESKIGEIIIDEKQGIPVKILRSINEDAYYEHFAEVLGNERQSAVLGSYGELQRADTELQAGVTVAMREISNLLPLEFGLILFSLCLHMMVCIKTRQQ
ncbi:nucleoside hydrolase 3-like isoform X1 [Syzygium oleosum]|uniref:nucleoside hydrolase 3-like isoform X1 n=3 Tax=Syzygium oleosum TaxID=219896 RepID=UPI0011D2C109|nr:nucleoside hydrolase 3-like isoform X1 [Syzygium oleosum]XP_030466977.1 nucleoside hydrolase 3-like isoform X1 [Syzygium oleosum]